MASGLASTPSSCTWSPAAPSNCLASTIDCVVSGQTVVHSESSKDSMTTLPRNWLSDICWPNWLTSVRLGAGLSPAEEPRSRLGFSIAASLFALVDDCAPDDCADPPDGHEAEGEQPPTASAAAPARPVSQVARRTVLFARSMPARLSYPRP